MFLKPYLIPFSLELTLKLQAEAVKLGSIGEALKIIAKILGVLGDGEPYFMASLLLLAGGYHFEFNQFVIQFILALIIKDVVKLYLADPRPYFIDTKYALSGVVDCSAEFGNPSGHSTMAGVVFFFFKHQCLGNGALSWTFTIFAVLLFGLCRVFGGMHTLD